MKLLSKLIRRLFHRPRLHYRPLDPSILPSHPEPYDNDVQVAEPAHPFPYQPGDSNDVSAVRKASPDDNSQMRFSQGGATGRERHPDFTRSLKPATPEEYLTAALCFASYAPSEFARRVQQGVREVFGGNPVPFYRTVGISRSAYSRIISHPQYHPSKHTALSMAAAFRLSLPQAEEFIKLAGYALSSDLPADLVWRYCFTRAIHDLSTIRTLLERIA